MVDDAYDATEPRPLIGVTPRLGTAAAVPTTLRIAVTNAAAKARVLSVAAIGLDASWTEGPQRTDVLQPGESAVVEIRLLPPLGTLPASYPLVVAAQPLDPETGRPTTTGTGTAETVLVVNPRTQLSVDLKPSVVNVVGSRRFAVEVRNSGAATAEVKLALKSTTHVSFSLRRDTLRVRPDETVVVRARARARRPSMIGPRSIHSFTLSARGSEAVKHVDGQVVQRSLIGPTGVKAFFLVLALVVWAGAAVVFIPHLAERVQTSSEESAALDAPSTDAEAEAAEDAAGGTDADGGSEAEPDAGGAAAGGGAADEGLQLSGTVAGESPAGVSVVLEPTSLVDEEAQGGTGVGVADSALDGTGMRLASALLRSAPERAVAERSVQTAADGSWAFPAVAAPGYYLVSFTKPGYQSQRFVVDASSAAASEPLEVDLQPGEGKLSGRILGPDGKPEGGVSISITDGTNTAVTNSNSEGDVGAWSIAGLSTPSTYVVTATKHDMSSEARVVPLAAGASGTASLQLVDGVGLLTGSVKANGLDGRPKGVGGITVTVSDGQGDVRTATTLTQDPRGSYAIPSLPAPGSYSVTVSGTGYQSQTKTLRLGRGQAAESLDFDLNQSSGRLSGRVVTAGAGGVEVGWPNTGLTLSNTENSYKSMSTEAGTRGGYEFAGVEPGSYVLTASYFGKKTVHQNVEVTTGPSKSWTITLVDDGSQGLTATSTIEGSVIDAVTQLPVPANICDLAGNEPDCLTAEIRQPTVPETTPRTYDTYTTSFAPGENYLLPDPDLTPGAGLRPGLHTVTIRVPGYEVGTVDVELGVDTGAIAPLAQLFPAPTVTGLVTASYDGAHPTSCVWVVPGNLGSAQLESELGSCAAARTDPDGARCTASAYPFLDEDAPTDAYCAASDATGAYSVQVPKVGDYTVWAQPLNPEYAASEPRYLNLGRGATESANLTLARYGELALTVTKPGKGDALKPVPAGVTINVTGGSRFVATPVVTLTGGTATVTGLRPNVAYTVSATTTLTDVDDVTSLATVSGELTNLSAGMNQSTPGRLRLTRLAQGFSGRVVSSLDDKDAPDDRLAGATVELELADGFTGDTDAGTPSYPTSVTTLTSDAEGCFAVTATTGGNPPPRLDDCISSGLSGSTWDPASIAARDVATARVKSLTISAPGFTTETRADYPFRSTVATPFTLHPTPIPISAAVGYTPVVTGKTGPDWSAVRLEVTDGPDAAGLPVVGLSGTGATKALTWDDASLPAGQVLPGRYEIAVTAPAGYASIDSAVLTCPVQPTAAPVACTWSGPGVATAPDGSLLLQEQGTIAVTVRGQTPTGLVDITSGFQVQFSRDGKDDGPKAGPVSGISTFGPLDPETIDGSRFRVTVDGYEPGDTLAPTDGTATLVLSCTDPDPRDGDPAGTGASIVVRPGLATHCVLTLTKKLGSVSGTLFGLMYPEGNPPSATDRPTYVENLGNVRVTLERCSSMACTSVQTIGTRVTSLGTADDSHTGGEFSFVATTSELKPGIYRIGVAGGDLPNGYRSPTLEANLAPFRLEQGQTKTGLEVDLYAKTVDLEVSVVDDVGRPLTTNTTVYAHRGPIGLPQGGDGVSTTTNTGGVYTLTSVMPGWTTVYVTSAGTGTGQQVLVATLGTGARQRVPITVVRPRGNAAGVVDTREGSTPVLLGGATITLRCTPTADPASAYCRPGTEPAVDLVGDPLTRQTDGGGRYSFTDVPIGTYTATVTKRGYRDQTTTIAITTVTTDDQQPTITLPGVGKQVTVTLTSTDTSDQQRTALRTLGVTLVGVNGSPSPGSMTFSGTGGTYTATFPNVRWGCYRVEFARPTTWQGTIARTTPAPGSLPSGCTGADLVIDDETTTPTTAALDYTLASRRVEWTIARKVGGFMQTLPPVTLTLRPTSGAPITFAGVSPTDALYVPPATYAVTAAVPADDAVYWRITQPSEALNLENGSSPSPPSIYFEEQTFPVEVSVPSLTGSQTATLRYDKGAGQTGVPLANNSATTVNGTYTFDLPRGTWQIRGAWPSGPGAGTITVVAGQVLRLQLNPFVTPSATPTPSSTPTAPTTPTAPGTTAPTTTPPATTSPVDPTSSPGSGVPTP